MNLVKKLGLLLVMFVAAFCVLQSQYKRCVAEDVLLRTFCSSPQAGLVWGRKECVQETDSRLTF